MDSQTPAIDYEGYLIDPRQWDQELAGMKRPRVMNAG